MHAGHLPAVSTISKPADDQGEAVTALRQPLPTTMQAVVCTKYGAPEHLQLQSLATPQPDPQQVLIEVAAASVTAADSVMRQGTSLLGRLFLGLRKPNIGSTGTGFAGTVVQVGGNVTDFKLGDRVFGETGMKFSSHAQYICMPATGLMQLTPVNMTDAEAATLCDGALTSYNFLFELGQLKAGEQVLINGASGSLGTAAVQLAKHRGAHVTAVCSAKNTPLVRSLGADAVIDYQTTDFTQLGLRFDVVYDCVGKSSYFKCRDMLSRKGRYLSPAFGVPHLLLMLCTHLLTDKKALFAATGMKSLPTLHSMLRRTVDIYLSAQLQIVMDRSYPLAQAVQANTYVDSGRKRGNVVFTFAPTQTSLGPA